MLRSFCLFLYSKFSSSMLQKPSLNIHPKTLLMSYMAYMDQANTVSVTCEMENALITVLL